MSQLFEKAAVFTDIHFGAKSDSEQHNLDCRNFVKWFCQQVKENDCDTIMFLGDWFDNRSRLRVDTISHSWEAITELRNLELPTYWLVGNHDIFFRHHRTIHSLPYLLEDKNLFIINELMEVGNVLFSPWLTGNEFAEVPGYDVKYIFGHFELPLFLLNENIIMPDKGGLHADHFTKCDAVFSGHFHKRQLKVNEHGTPIYYIGNAFPHNYNDVNDTDRGCMILEWGQDPEFINWPDAPTYHRMLLSDLLAEAEAGTIDQLHSTSSTVEVKDDVGIEIEEAMELKELLGSNFRDLKLRPSNPELDATVETEIGDDAQSVDDMVVEHLHLLDTKGSDFDAELLVSLYQGVRTD